MGLIRSRMVSVTDERAKAMNETLSGIKVRFVLMSCVTAVVYCLSHAVKFRCDVFEGSSITIFLQVVKLFGWEAAMATRVAEIRGREVALMRSGAFVRVVNVVTASIIPSLVTLSVFLTYTLGTGQTLSASQVRSGLSRAHRFSCMTYLLLSLVM